MSPDVSGGGRPPPLVQLPYAMVDPPRPRNELLLRRRGGSTPLSSEAAAAALGWGCFRLTFWPRFYNSSSYPRNQLEKKDGGLQSTSFCTEFRCGSCGDSHFCWGCHICKVL